MEKKSKEIAKLKEKQLKEINNLHVRAIAEAQKVVNDYENKQQKLEKSIEVFHMSMFEIKFPRNAFDIIWSEGAIFPIGFHNALKSWI